MDQGTEEFLAAVARLSLRFPNAEIAKATGMSKGMISKLLNGTTPPSEKFMKLFYQKFPKALPHETNLTNTENAPLPDGNYGITDKVSIDRILRVLEIQASTLASQQQTIQTLANKINPIEAGAVAG